jgi:hypothetical protein
MNKMEVFERGGSEVRRDLKIKYIYYYEGPRYIFLM